ncbi:MAG: protein-L-isoaspartate O-methyltransferase [Burkholderiales bacterium]|nr:protein-L-isoaspartate O-methyltransferase [Burkholderiales bacterium]
MDFEQARFNMVEQQIRTWEVLDQGVLDLLLQMKREDFVPVAYRAIAFTDMEIPIGDSQLMMAPKMEARIVQELAPKATDRVLEVGTGSGYLTALLASRAATVTSVEFYDSLSRNAASNLDRANIRNVNLKVGDGAESPATFTGPDEKFDVIVLTGSVPTMPQAYLDALTENGRLFAIVGDAPVMKATLYTRAADKAFVRAEIFETVIAPLINAKQPSRFDF